MMEPKPFNLGSSKPVPSVQELAKEPLTIVPPRYVRDLDQDDSMVSDKSSDSEIPVIDMQSLMAEEGAMGPELEKLHHACQDWGFFQLINHGVSSYCVEKMKVEIQEFFKLPMEEKKKFYQHPGEVEGLGQAFVVSEEQKLDWADMEALEAYSLELKNLAMAILHQMVKALKIKSEEITDLFEEGFQGMRMNYYPPCPQPNRTIGLSPHSDGSGLTILLQVNEKEGLHIRKDGMWIPITPLPNAFVVNVGDVLEIVTNGIYRSVEHRAVVNSKKERLSIATFYSPRYDAELEPAQSLTSPETPALFRRIGVQEYYKGRFSRKLNGKSYIDVMRIQNDDGKDA